MQRFRKNNHFKENYKNTLKQINYISKNLKNDDDKIRLLSLINNLKYYASSIEPQESIDLYNKKYKV
jgi:hypothetical protein